MRGALALTPVLTADGAVVCSIDGKTLHLDRQSWADAEHQGHHRMRVTCGDHDVWIEYRAPQMILRAVVLDIDPNAKRCLQCDEPLEAKRQHLAKIHVHCRPAFRRAKRQAALPPKLRGRRQGENLHRRPSPLARALKEQTMAGLRRTQ